MAKEAHRTSAREYPSVSIDTWAVILAFVLALAVKFDVFKNVPW
jgi:hypothetical protein